MPSDDIGCFEPLCTDPADVLGMDEMFGVHVAFCEEHVENWNDIDHITLEDDRLVGTGTDGGGRDA